MECQTNARSSREPWNRGKVAGQKAPLKLKEIWAIRARLQLADRRRTHAGSLDEALRTGENGFVEFKQEIKGKRSIWDASVIRRA